MQNRTAVTILVLCLTVPLAADQKPPAFYFGGKPIFIGMAQADAVAILTSCCKFTPPNSEDENPPGANHAVGHFIMSKDKGPILGSIFFSGGRVFRINRPLDEDVNSESDDAVALASAIDRSLTQDLSDSPATVIVSARHVPMKGADSEVLTLTFPNGRGIELQIFTLDSPPKATGKRDAISLDEILESPTR
jgi:hypothetical protein